LTASGCRRTLAACVMMARILRSTRQDAHGPWAGAIIAVLGGRCAEKGAGMPATISDDRLAELVAMQWRLSSLCDEMKVMVDDAVGRITSEMVEQVDDGSSTDDVPSPFYAKVLGYDEVAS
jgi:hypothetical protein